MLSRILRAIPLGRLRLAQIEDAPAIMPLLNESMFKNFRVEQIGDIVYLIETCVLSVCLLDINETIVGVLLLKDFPLTPSVNPGAWEDFVWTKFKAVELNARNTLFIHLLCWNPIYGREAVDNMLKSVFMHDPYLQYIGMMKSLVNYQLLVPGQSRCESSFKRYQALERGVPGDQLPTLWVAERREVSPRLRIRRAVEEDNDDIVPIIERHSVRLRELYGDFYVSELISRHPESERILLVCEHKELAVGVMCLNTQINYQALEESFELSPFSGLRHPDELPYKMENDSVSSLCTGTGNFVFESQQDSNADIQTTKEAKSRVTWVFEEDAFKNIPEAPEVKLRPHQVSISQLDFLQLLEDEEDEIEYDIVNIDNDLLRLPRLFMNEDLLKKQRYSEEYVPVRKESMFENKYIVKDTIKKLSTASANIITDKTPEPTRYSGQPNAFLLELFAMHPDYDERYGFDMLEAVYELFPGRDYCVMCLPSSHTCFPLLEHFTLVTPYSFRIRFINETLYVAHVNSVRGEIRVRPAETYDRKDLNDVLEHSPRKEDLISLYETSLESSTLSSYVFLSQNQPVGLIVLGPLEDATSIRTQYDLDVEAKRSGTDASILTCIVSPIMEPHGRWYLRDTLRQTKYTTLFWICRLFAKGDASPSRNLMSLASHMLPVRPRRYIPHINGNQSLDKVFREIATPFALWTLDRPLASMPKVLVNNSIVVVGASRTGLAFIETLLLGPTSEYLTFTNITLVSQHGLPTVSECTRAAETCVPRDGRYTDTYIKSVPFYYYVDVMSAVMVRINRKKKCIHLKGGGVKFYDELVLTCGKQFQHPEYLNDTIETAKEVEKGKPCERILMDNPMYKPDSVPISPDLPENVMLINSLYEANISFRKLMRMMSDTRSNKPLLDEDNPVVVYGECIEAYSCIAALLELGLTPNLLAFVEPFPPEDTTAMRVNCFNNETIDERVQASIDKLGIRVYRKCYFHGWSKKDTRVEFIRLMTPLLAIHVQCFALFYYGIKAIDLNAFKAINETGLVYDGGLVVGPRFDTNDPHVYGAGPCAKYSRRLYAPKYQHGYYCSEDVGEALANLFLQKLDPFMTEASKSDSVLTNEQQRYSSCLLARKRSHPSETSADHLPDCIAKSRWEPVMRFESPLVQSATLPGPLYFMHLRKPGRDVPMAVKLLLPHQGHTLITDKRQNYFRLQINSTHCIESITCLSKKQFSRETLTQLYGKHEAYFKNLLSRFQMDLIDDLYDYFIQTWTVSLYQEPFGVLLDDIYEQAGRKAYGAVKMKYEDLKDVHKTVDDTLTAESSFENMLRTHKTNCEECEQSQALRHEAVTFWKDIRGENVVYSQLARYLDKNIVTNPHYAVPKQDMIEK